MKRSAIFLTACALALLPVMGAAQQIGTYTADQAQQGQAIYADQCADCHGKQLQGAFAPPLTGPDFHQMAASQHLTGQSLYDRISRSMPRTAPGKLKPEEYEALVAFILQRSGYPAGAKPLDPDNADLAALDLGK